MTGRHQTVANQAQHVAGATRRLPPSRMETFHQRTPLIAGHRRSEIAAGPPGRCTGMDSLLDCLLDFASRNGLSALRVHRQRPWRGALRVHPTHTVGSTWKTLSRLPHRPSMKSHQQHQERRRMRRQKAGQMPRHLAAGMHGGMDAWPSALMPRDRRTPCPRGARHFLPTLTNPSEFWASPVAHPVA